MDQPTSNLGPPPLITLALACFLYAFSIILIDIAPFFIGMYVDYLGLTLSQASFVQTIDQGGGILGAIAGFFLMPRFTWRTLVIAASIIAIIANLFTAMVDSYLSLSIVRFFSGFGVVLITTVTACTVARAASPDRAFGIGLALGMSLSAAAIWLLDILRAEYGPAASLGSGTLWLGAGLILAFFLPRTLGGKDETLHQPDNIQAVPGDISVGRTALIALLLFGISINVVYAFVERVGLANGLDQGGVANALAFGYIFSAFGCLVPTIFGAIGGRLKWIALTTVLLLGSLMALYAANTVALYTAAFAIYASAWNMGLAYYMSLTVDNDPEQRFSRMMYIVNVAAQSLGPLIAALLLTKAPLHSVFIIAPLPALAAFLMVIAASYRGTNQTG